MFSLEVTPDSLDAGECTFNVGELVSDNARSDETFHICALGHTTLLLT